MRTAITFTPHPPIHTTLVRYYEKGFRKGWQLWARLRMLADRDLFVMTVIMIPGSFGV